MRIFVSNLIFIIMKAIDRIVDSGKSLFGTPIMMDVDNKFLSLTDLQYVYAKKRIELKWSDKRINDILSNKNSIEKIYFVIKNRYLKGISRNTFIERVNETSLTKTVKEIGVYRTYGRGKSRITMCIKEIFIMVAMELHPSIYDECIKVFGISDIDSAVSLFIQNKNLFSELYNMSFKFFNGENPMHLIKAINKYATGDESPLMYTVQEENKIIDTQKELYIISKNNLIESMNDLINIITDKTECDDKNSFFFTYLAIDQLSKEIKVGKTFDIKTRENVMRTANPRLKIFAKVDKDIESEVHENLKNKRVIGEWFKLSANDLKRVFDEYGFELLDGKCANYIKKLK